MKDIQIPSSTIKKVKSTSTRYKVGAIGFDENGSFVGDARSKPRLNKKGGGLHAEIELLRKYGPKIKHMVVFRVTKSGLLRSIDVCDNCRKVLDKLNIDVLISC